MATKKEKSVENKKTKDSPKKKKAKKVEKVVEVVEFEAEVIAKIDDSNSTEETVIIEETENEEVVDIKVADDKSDLETKVEEDPLEKDSPIVDEEIIEEEIDNNSNIDSEEDEEYDTLNIWEKFLKFEGDTKIGVATGIFILISHPILFNWDWVNHSWFVILIVAFISLRYLNKQRLELEEDKPFEAKFANISFIAVLVLLVLRDLAITSRLDDLIEIISNLRKI